MTRLLCEIELPRESLARLRAMGLEVDTVAPHGQHDWEFASLGKPCPEGLICKRPPRDIGSMSALRWVQIATVGYEHLRGWGFQDSSITFTNARGLFDSSIAEWCMGMMVALLRDLPGMLRDQAHGVWRREARQQQEIRGKTVGLWGYGGIGRETARVARALGLIVHVLTRNAIGPRRDFTPAGTGDPAGTLPHRAFLPSEKSEFLAGLDFLVLALPHTKESDGMVGTAELETLPKRAVLLNPARGPIVQEQALLEALRRGRIAGAALDTHWRYPLPADHPLWRFPNVILTPHVAGADGSALFAGRMAELVEENARRWLAGERLLNGVTQAEWREA